MKHYVQGSAAICGNNTIVGAECRIKGGDGTLTRDMVTKQHLERDCTTEGLICRNMDNHGGCRNYEVRYRCRGKKHVLFSDVAMTCHQVFFTVTDIALSEKVRHGL